MSQLTPTDTEQYHRSPLTSSAAPGWFTGAGALVGGGAGALLAYLLAKNKKRRGRAALIGAAAGSGAGALAGYGAGRAVLPTPPSPPLAV